MALFNAQQFTKEIGHIVSQELDASRLQISEIAHTAPCDTPKYLKEIISREGKRMRSIFISLLVRALGNGFLIDTVSVCSSIELLHLATLIHDDIIDESELRRNAPTAYRKWGTRKAVLLGDYLLAKSIDCVLKHQDTRIVKSINNCASLLVAGEILEVEKSGDFNLTEKDYFTIIHHKTASLWSSCAECAALITKQNLDTVQLCIHIGKNLGMAFQLADDLLDYGLGAELGKKELDDIQQEVITYPLIYFFQNSTDKERQNMIHWLKNSNEINSQKSIILALKQKNCFAQTFNKVNEFIKKCTEDLQKLPQNKYSQKLLELLSLLEERSKVHENT